MGRQRYWIVLYACGCAFEMYPRNDPIGYCPDCSQPKLFGGKDKEDTRLIDGYSPEEYEKLIE